jgi:hypothetical protein
VAGDGGARPADAADGLTPVRVVALVPDLMDRARVSDAVPGATFVHNPAAVEHADVVIVDLARFADAVPAVRRAAPGARIVAFGAHVDTDTLDRAARDGADAAMARSRFFRDPAAAIAGEPG